MMNILLGLIIVLIVLLVALFVLSSIEDHRRYQVVQVMNYLAEDLMEDASLQSNPAHGVTTNISGVMIVYDGNPDNSKQFPQIACVAKNNGLKLFAYDRFGQYIDSQFVPLK